MHAGYGQKNKCSDIKCVDSDITILTTNGYHDLDFFNYGGNRWDRCPRILLTYLMSPASLCNFVIKNSEMGEAEGMKIIRKKKSMTLFMDGPGLT